MTASMTSTRRNDAEIKLNEFRSAYEALRFKQAHSAIEEALRLDPIFTWGEIARSYSGMFVDNVRRSRSIHKSEVLLSDLYEASPHMINIAPPTDDPEIEAKNLAWRKRNIEQGLPYLLFIAQGQSGSTVIGNIVPQGFKLTCTTYSMITERVIPNWARDYARGGSYYVTHLNPTKTNIKRLVATGLTKAIINIRDPRQAFLSQIHYSNKYKNHFPMLERVGFFDMSLNKQIVWHLQNNTFFKKGQLPRVEWITGWMEAEQQGMTILFVSYEDFIGNRVLTLDRMLEFYGGDMRYFDRDAALSTNENIDYHFRNGEIDEWRRIIPRKTVQQLNDSMPVSFFTKFGWNP